MRNRFISVASVLGLVLLVGKATCDSICPNGITNIKASSGVLAYPSSGDYGINETKCWKIEVPDTYKGIYYSFNKFDIEICKDCDCDGIQVVRASMYNSLASIGKNCERLSDDYLEYRRRLGNPFAYDKPETSLYVRFVSDDTVHRKGFNFSFIAYSDFDGKESYLNASKDETIEFGTPKVGIKKYPENFEQQWYLIVPEGQQVQIDFDIFELEQSERCKNDYVEIREVEPIAMRGNIGPILTGRLCGSTMPTSIQSSGNMAWVHFRSDKQGNSSTAFKGFKASFKAVGSQGRTSASNRPSTLLFISALLVVAAKNSLF